MLLNECLLLLLFRYRLSPETFGYTLVGWERVHGMHLVQDRDQWWVLANTTMNLRVP